MRRRVLLSCYYFSPYRSGEAAVGWCYATGLARDHEATILFGDLSDSKPMLVDLDRYLQENRLPDGFGKAYR
ncbi:MAG: hypothetical protein OSA84_11995 [Akkermansiaceae bacterium]|nr:hypothetical protein [Akkermansiaceae bacterium]